MKKETKKLTEVLEKKEVQFDLTEGEGDIDRINISCTGDLTDYEIRILIYDDAISALSFPINVVKEEKYGVLLEILNNLNYEYRFAKFFASKNDGEESYYVAIQADSVYGDELDPEKIFDFIGSFAGALEEAYPQIVKAIA